VPIVLKYGNLNLLETSGLVQVLTFNLVKPELYFAVNNIIINKLFKSYLFRTQKYFFLFGINVARLIIITSQVPDVSFFSFPLREEHMEEEHAKESSKDIPMAVFRILSFV
jgi:hypothetical protein